jgi:allophanate hydrolase subunit 2
VSAGQLLAVGTDAPDAISGASAVPAAPRRTLRIEFGPRADWFTADALSRLVEAPWTVRPDSNRIGVRLGGGALTRARAGELATEATLPGAVQVPPDGRPILLGPDAPVTGGYPVVAVVIDADLDAAGQLRPGAEVSFAPVRS